MSSFSSILSYCLIAIPTYYLLPYLARWRWLAIPSPFPASFTNLWLLYQCRRRRRYLAVDQAHEKYGKIVRIQPHHVSIADVGAIQFIYGHGNGFLKSYAQTYTHFFLDCKVGCLGTGNTMTPSPHPRIAAFSTRVTEPSTHESARLPHTPSQ